MVVTAKKMSAAIIKWKTNNQPAARAIAVTEAAGSSNRSSIQSWWCCFCGGWHFDAEWASKRTKQSSCGIGGNVSVVGKINKQINQLVGLTLVARSSFVLSNSQALVLVDRWLLFLFATCIKPMLIAVLCLCQNGLLVIVTFSTCANGGMSFHATLAIVQGWLFCSLQSDKGWLLFCHHWRLIIVCLFCFLVDAIARMMRQMTVTMTMLLWQWWQQQHNNQSAASSATGWRLII